MFHAEMEDLERSLIKGLKLGLEEPGAAAAVLNSHSIQTSRQRVDGELLSLQLQGPQHAQSFWSCSVTTGSNTVAASQTKSHDSSSAWPGQCSLLFER